MRKVTDHVGRYRRKPRPAANRTAGEASFDFRTEGATGRAAGEDEPVAPANSGLPLRVGASVEPSDAVATAEPALEEKTVPWTSPCDLRTKVWPYVVAVLLLPVVALLQHDNFLFSPLGYIDPWIYYGFFHNLGEFKRDLFPGTYFGSRLAFLLPGYVLHHLLRPVPAAYMLHLGFHSIASVSLFWILRFTNGVRAAFLTALLFTLHPWLWWATGMDYVDGAAIAYYLAALALLVMAAARRPGRLYLTGAGIAVAGMIYVHLFCAPFAPPLLAAYVALCWLWSRESAWRSALRFCTWSGSGFLAATLFLGAVNYFLEGKIWFYAPSMETAVRLVKYNPWFEKVADQRGLFPFLWFGAAALLTAAAMLPFRLRRRSMRTESAGLLFSALFFCALAMMAYLQFRRIHAALGLIYYASYLLPFIFLVFGSSLWPGAARLSERGYLWLCAAAVALMALLWWDKMGRYYPLWPHDAHISAAVCTAILGAALLLRRRTAGAVLAVIGIPVLTAAIRPSTQTDPHYTRKDYGRLTRMREQLEVLRGQRPIRFWYDEREPSKPEFVSLSSTYLWLPALLGRNFPQKECPVNLQPPVLIVVTTNRPQPDALAAASLASCWGPGFRLRPELVEEVAGRYGRYWLAALAWEEDRDRLQPAEAVFEPDGRGYLRVNPKASGTLPLGRLQPESGKYTAEIRAAPGGLSLKTPPVKYNWAGLYPSMLVEQAGLYRFSLRYRSLSGKVAFGAAKADSSGWIGVSYYPQADGDEHQLVFWCRLQAGQQALLRVANNRETDSSTSLVITSIQAFRLRE